MATTVPTADPGPPPSTPPGLDGERPGLLGRLRPSSLTDGVATFPLVALCLAAFLRDADATLFALLSPDIRRTYHLGLTGIAAVGSVTLFLAYLLEPFVGYVADRARRTYLVAFGTLMYGAFTALTGLAGFLVSLPLLFLARIGAGSGQVFSSTRFSLLSDFYPPKTRPKVFYAYQLATVTGQLLGPLLGGFLTVWLAWEYPFVVMAIPTALIAVLFIRMREPKRGYWERVAAGADDATAELEEEPAGFMETFQVLWSRPSTRRIYYSLPFLSASLIGFVVLLQNFYDQVFHVNAAGRGVITAIAEPFQVAGLLTGAIVVQRVVQRNPGRALSLLGVVAVFEGMCIIGVALSPGLVVAVTFHILYTAAQAMLLPGILAVVSMAIPPRMRTLGFATGSLWLVLGLPALLLAGGIGDAIGIRAGMAVFLPIFILGSLLLASAGKFLTQDIARINLSARAQAEFRQARHEGRAQLLRLEGLDAGYEGVQVLFGVDMEVGDGEIVALLGTNGAGKSTLLKVISGLLPPTAGIVVFDGNDITAADPNRVTRKGIIQVPGGRGIFPTLTVGENLRAAGWLYRDDSAYTREATEQVLSYFPILRERWDTSAGSLSGGEQQMLSLSQAFIAKPKLLMIDELSLGLAPVVVEQLLEIVRAIHDRGATVILVEQSVNVALQLARRAVFLEKGEVRFSGPTADLLERPDILRSVFLQGAAAGMGQPAGNGEVAGASVDGRAGSSDTRGRRDAAKADRQAAEEAARRREVLAGPVVLETIGLAKRYGGVMAVWDVGLTLHEGQILGLIGPNGAGKTTVFDLITGLTPADGGRVILGGLDVTGLPTHDRAALGLGRSFQDARLWPALTVREALAVAMERRVAMRQFLPAWFNLPQVRLSEARVARQVEEVIELLRLEAFRDKFVSELSTGSRRMVEIGAMLAHRPGVLLLDEPSSGIAQRESEALGPVLRNVQQHMGCSILIIEHDMPLIASLADHIVAMEQGQVVVVGAPKEVLEHPQVIASYLGDHSVEEVAEARPNGGRTSSGTSGARATTSRGARP